MHGNGSSSESNDERYTEDCFRLWRKLNTAGLRNKEKFLSVFKDTLTEFEYLKAIEDVLSKETVELPHLMILLLPISADLIGSQAEYLCKVQKFEQTLEKFLEQEAISEKIAYDSLDSRMFMEIQDIIKNAEKNFIQKIADVINLGESFTSSDHSKIEVIVKEQEITEKSLNRCILFIYKFIQNTEQKEDLLEKVASLKKKLNLCTNVLKNRRSKRLQSEFSIYIGFMLKGQFEELEQSLREIFAELRNLEAELFPLEPTPSLKNQIPTNKNLESQERGEGSPIMPSLLTNPILENNAVQKKQPVSSDQRNRRLQMNTYFGFEYRPNQNMSIQSNLIKLDEHSDRFSEEFRFRFENADYDIDLSSIAPIEIYESNGEIDPNEKREIANILHEISLNSERNRRANGVTQGFSRWSSNSTIKSTSTLMVPRGILHSSRSMQTLRRSIRTNAYPSISTIRSQNYSFEESQNRSKPFDEATLNRFNSFSLQSCGFEERKRDKTNQDLRQGNNGISVSLPPAPCVRKYSLLLKDLKLAEVSLIDSSKVEINKEE